jgi:hypothetical protein
MPVRKKDFDSMKRGAEATSQYSELASALRQLDAGWIVTEVEEVIARGKAIPFRALSEGESIMYENRLLEETGRGVMVARARANDTIGVSYEPHERLVLLVEAVERVVTASELSRSYISSFAAQRGITSINLERPAEADIAAGTARARGISLQKPALANERLSILHHVLHDEVLS